MEYGLSGLMPGDGGITQTVTKMVQAVNFSLGHYALRKRAEDIIATCPERDEECEVRSVYNWVSSHFHYVRDPRGLEMFKSPEVADAEISSRGTLIGDCDDVSAYMAALLVAIGYKVSFIVINLPGQGPDFKHIYAKAWLPRAGRWVSLDATARGTTYGFEAPNGGRWKEYPV